MTLDWIVNEGNREVWSTLSRASNPDTLGQRWSTYDNRPLLPYVGKPGWVIESPEYDDDADLDHRVAVVGHIKYWSRVFVKDDLLTRLLKSDDGLYRARWVFPNRNGKDFFLYSSVMVRGTEDMKYVHERLQYLHAEESHLWKVEELVELTSEKHQCVYAWLEATQPTWADSKAFRLKGIR